MCGRRTIIRNQITSGLVPQGSVAVPQQHTATTRRRVSKTRIKSSTIAIYASVFTLLIVVIALGYRSPQQVSSSGASTPVLATIQSSDESEAAVNKVVASSIAANVANSTNLAVAPSVNSLAISTQIESELPSSESSSLNKPQILPVSAASRDITAYVVKEGDTAESVATQFGISKDTVKWANNLTTDTLTVGTSLEILPRNGIVYVVKSGDTIESIAEKYKAKAATIRTYNDLEISGLTTGLKIIIPDGVLPTTERPGYVAPQAVSVASYAVGYSSGFNGSTFRIKIGTPMYAGNTYYTGNCTAYAYDRRVELGLPVSASWGNAATWARAAGATGLRVSNTPTIGAIIQNGGGYGHVAIVEKILPNGDLELSEMNAYVSGGGWNIVSGRILPAANVGQYAYIQ